MKLILEVSDIQIKAILQACDFMARLYMGQTEELRLIKSPNGSNDLIVYDQIKKITHPELTPNSYYSICSENIPDQARILMDIHDVIRHFLAWESQANSPETRDWVKQIGVQYDTPVHLHEEPLPTIKRRIISNENKKNK
jgi:hypothetical protein